MKESTMECEECHTFFTRKNLSNVCPPCLTRGGRNTVAEVAQCFEVTPQAVGGWIRTGKIPVYIFKGANNKPTRYMWMCNVVHFLLTNKANKKAHVLDTARRMHQAISGR